MTEELKRMYKLAGLINENESFEEGKWGRGGSDPWADIETGGEYSKSKERVSAAYKRQREEDQDLSSASYQSFISKIKRLGSLMTDDEAIDMVDDMKRMLSHNEIVNVYRFLDNNNISSPIYTHLDGYVGEMGGLRNQGDLYENENLDEAIEGGLTFDELPDKIKDYFRRNITMSVAFVKKDGSVRHMAFRRNLKSYEKSDKEKTDRQANVLSNNNLMNVYDTNSFIRLKRETGDAAQAAKGSFRNFKLDNVLAFLTGGQLFDMRDQNQIGDRFGEEVYASLTPSMISALKSDEVQGSEDVDQYEGPENPIDNPVDEAMIQEGELGKVIARMLKEEFFKK